ncbi:MAG: zinc ribbon domain-containing protein [Lachnospiraceae bacterium]|jgi:hypothetical protein|nr:zinc ribbon domain-containing protein [Lachnospiraceae bacterium]
MICKVCGKEIPNNALRCPYCGAIVGVNPSTNNYSRNNNGNRAYNGNNLNKFNGNDNARYNSNNRLGNGRQNNSYNNRYANYSNNFQSAVNSRNIRNNGPYGQNIKKIDKKQQYIIWGVVGGIVLLLLIIMIAVIASRHHTSVQEGSIGSSDMRIEAQKLKLQKAIDKMPSEEEISTCINEAQKYQVKDDQEENQLNTKWVILSRDGLSDIQEDSSKLNSMIEERPAYFDVDSMNYNELKSAIKNVNSWTSKCKKCIDNINEEIKAVRDKYAIKKTVEFDVKNYGKYEVSYDVMNFWSEQKHIDEGGGESSEEHISLKNTIVGNITVLRKTDNTNPVNLKLYTVMPQPKGYEYSWNHGITMSLSEEWTQSFYPFDTQALGYYIYDPEVGVYKKIYADVNTKNLMISSELDADNGLSGSEAGVGAANAGETYSIPLNESINELSDVKKDNVNKIANSKLYITIDDGNSTILVDD